MDDQRLARFHSALKDTVAAFAAAETLGVIVTIADLTISPDQHKATAFVTVLPEARSAETVETLNQAVHNFRAFAKTRIRRGMLPALTFAEAESATVREAFDQLRYNKSKADESEH